MEDLELLRRKLARTVKHPETGKNFRLTPCRNVMQYNV